MNLDILVFPLETLARSSLWRWPGLFLFLESLGKSMSIGGQKPTFSLPAIFSSLGHVLGRYYLMEVDR